MIHILVLGVEGENTNFPSIEGISTRLFLRRTGNKYFLHRLGIDTNWILAFHALTFRPTLLRY